MKRISFILLFCGLAASGLWAQESTVKIKEGPKIDALFEQFINANKNQAFVSGYRIQLLATTDRQKMEYSLQQFRALYPSIPVDWEHDPPYYKIRAGAFATELDALRILHILKNDYGQAYTAQDSKIRPEEFVY
ncbi:MAG: SPOR domain-containing protein [Bacteroidota bacterium]